MAVPVPVDFQMVFSLRMAVRDCSERGLLVAAKWASAMLLALPLSKRRDTGALPDQTFGTSTPARSRSPRQSLALAEESPASGSSRTATQSQPEPLSQALQPSAVPLQPSTKESLALERTWEAEDEDAFAAGKAYMDSKEFARAAHVLKDCQSSKARVKASEKKGLRDWHKFDSDRRQPPVPVNTSLRDLLGKLQNVTDPWLLFLKGLLLSRLNRREEAIESIILSLAGYLWNWSAWLLLGTCIGDGEELSSLLPLLPVARDHPLAQMFQIKMLNELHTPSEHELALCNRLLTQEFFPSSAWIMSQRACVLYHLHSHTQAESQFQKSLLIDPCRIEDIDIYSNVLFVTHNNVRLSKLAHEFLELDKDRPEVCCLVGNHYSGRGEHEKAVKYFRRATQLDRTYLAGWTLMGHEYIEMKNSHAAVEAYRRAVDVNRKDYRAWYGLGQAYELLNMHNYALYYYQRATALRPYDVRLWQAQGMCYEDLGRPREAIECLKHALIEAHPHETNINSKLAKLYNDLEDYAEAAAYHRRIVEVCRITEKPVQEYSKSCVFVARYHMFMGGGDLNLARDYLDRVAHSQAEDVAVATELLKKVKVMIQQKAAQSPQAQAPQQAVAGPS